MSETRTCINVLIDRFLIFIVGVLTLSAVNSCSTEPKCEIAEQEWNDFDEKLNTCTLEPECGITEKDFTIADAQNLTVKAFTMQEDVKALYLPGNLFEKFPNLVVYHLEKSAIKEITENNFKGLHELTQLILAYMQIKHIDSNAFKDNSKLEYLRLDSNRIKYIGADLFKPLNNLKELILDHNQIRYVAPNAFESLTKVQELNMGFNEIKFLEANTFKTMINLQNISLSFNELEVVDENLLKFNVKVENIWFEQNDIKTVNYEMFVGMKNLDYVDFTGNICLNDNYSSDRFNDLKGNVTDSCSYETFNAEEKEKISKKMEFLNAHYKRIYE